ncbi:MFS transporter [Nigerium massiliense]|uniref:MFS transporter n=1 Tax=Nigerium massiliense TaxID=1522317 RepID=UPI001F3954D9|nr:MFS transporter [Nigerium massiliense]
MSRPANDHDVDLVPDGTEENHQTPDSILRQPKAVWAVAFACTVAFMGIGLVDPILPAISEQLHATPSQAMWLFTSYLFITGIAMFFTSWVSSRIGTKTALLIGLVLIVLTATGAGFANNVNTILGFRAGWGLGNALFISTALAAIVGAAAGGVDSAIMLYEAALGVGLACGPLLGGLLGSWSWRGPFFGTAALMAIGFIAIVVLLDKAERPEPIPMSVTGQALRHPVLMTLAAVAALYNYGFFSILAYSPFPLTRAAHSIGITVGALQLGLVFFGWGTLVALSGVLVAPRLTKRWGRGPVLTGVMVVLAVLLAIAALGIANYWLLVAVVVCSGAASGVVNTVLTEAVMESTNLPRSVASSTYSGVRFLGGAVSSALAGIIAASFGAAVPYWVAVGAFLAGALVLALRRRSLDAVDTHMVAVDEPAEG